MKTCIACGKKMGIGFSLCRTCERMEREYDEYSLETVIREAICQAQVPLDKTYLSNGVWYDVDGMRITNWIVNPEIDPQVAEKDYDRAERGYHTFMRTPVPFLEEKNQLVLF